MAPSRFLDIARPEDPEWSPWDRDLIRAFLQWEAACCPNCGTPHDIGLWDAKRSPTEQAKWLAGFTECMPCNTLEVSQHKQHLADENRRKQLRDDDILPTRGRLWSTWRDDNAGIQPKG